MIQTMNILAIGAHPDDIEYGCAGTLIKYAERGHHIYLMVLTSGQEGGSSEIRKQEQENAAELMSVQKIFWGGYHDTQLPLNKELIEKIEEVLGEVNPDLILVNYGDDTHQDHRILTQATMSATRYVRNVLFFEVPTTQNFNPQVYVDISDTLERKSQVLNAHASQVMKTNIEDMYIIELAQANATFRGIQGRVKFAEAFAPLRLFINI
ncbi:MAG: PIG-L family deacetylase [Deltaproteobacteria bacterium]|jgi:LmbE family N-acetylglucosaminyl deacetylase|nr:PIG-L family deacetylase [Deltaproteobacteria bacterium]